MAWTRAKDISRYQGAFSDTGEQIILIKMSGGDDGLYMDSQASQHYSAAVAASKAVGGYHFGGGVLGAEAEAAYFLKAMSPVAENDVFALDVEAALAGRADVVQWSLDFCHYIHDHTNVWPLVYMNLSTLNAHDWTPVLNNCGLWLADWAVSPDATIPTHYTYVMQQYSDGPNYDHDAFFGTVEQFKAYGYHATPSVPVQLPEPPPVAPTPEPIVEPAPEAPTPEAPAPAPAPGDVITPTEPEPVPVPVELTNTSQPPQSSSPTLYTQSPSLLGRFMRLLLDLIATLKKGGSVLRKR